MRPATRVLHANVVMPAHLGRNGPQTVTSAHNVEVGAGLGCVIIHQVTSN